MKTNLKVGDTVVCINKDPLPGNEVAPPLTKGNEYVVKDIISFPTENEHHLDVGLKSKYNWVTCHETGKEIPAGNEIHWCHPSRFEPK